MSSPPNATAIVVALQAEDDPAPKIRSYGSWPLDVPAGVTWVIAWKLLANRAERRLAELAPPLTVLARQALRDAGAELWADRLGDRAAEGVLREAARYGVLQAEVRGGGASGSEMWIRRPGEAPPTVVEPPHIEPPTVVAAPVSAQQPVSVPGGGARRSAGAGGRVAARGRRS